ncbi:MAG: cytochrome c oxidase subunit II [Acidobacteria bacterium]|nr:MAG: cytochrome c oxidase subunit II [Acidobacteriota bacterium]
MGSGLPLFPEAASTMAGRVDALYLFLVLVSVFFGLLIATLVVTFAIRFRRRSRDERPRPIHGSAVLELAWTLIPFGIVMVIFLWGAEVFFAMARVPPGAMEIYVVGKRWMWKTQHMTGQREINELHVPVGMPVKLTLTSEDVIHSFFVPAFRMKKDAVPGRYSTEWFQATRAGTYHLFCAEYCGTKHSGMIGNITVMEPAAFQAWLSGGATGTSLAAAGEKLFQDLACITCHRSDSEGRGPRLEGVFGHPVSLASGERVMADEAYVRESIVNPAARVVAGYQPVMPTYQGLVSEEGLMQLVAYIQSLGGPATAGPGAASEGRGQP